MNMKSHLPRPTRAVLNQKAAIEAKNTRESSDEWLALMSSYDWSSELFEVDGKYGLKSCVGEILLPAAFDDFKVLGGTYLPKGATVVAELDGKMGVVRADGVGEWLVAPEFDDIGYPNAITAVRKGNKWGVLDLTRGELLIPVELDAIYGGSGFMFVNGMAYYEKDGKVGVMNENGECTATIFDTAEPNESGVIEVTLNGETGFINREGQFTADEDEAWFMESDF